MSNLVKTLNGVTFIGTSLPQADAYSGPERQCWHIVSQQISQNFPDQKNLLISMTWFGYQFDNHPGWMGLMELIDSQQQFDNIFFLATVDPCYLSVTDLQWVKNSVSALRAYYLGNFDGAHQFNFFAIQLGNHFRHYDHSELQLDNINHLYVNYNRKPKPHRVEFVKKLINFKLLEHGIVTLGKDATNDLYLTLGEQQTDYIGTTRSDFGIPMDFYSLHRMDIWRSTFLYINAATEFDPVNDLFCQQDTFKPMLGLRPFVINGVQKTYRWLRLQGFKTFNHYWKHIDIEHGNVHDTIVELIQFLSSKSKAELQATYQDMLPDLYYNQERFNEFAREQQYKLSNLF